MSNRLLLVGILLAAACGPPDPIDVCATMAPGPVRSAEVGTYDDAETFTPYVEGGETPLIAGFQGGYMVTPVIRFPAEAGDDATPCVNLRIANDLSGSEGPALNYSIIVEAEGGMYTLDGINNFLGNVRSDLIGQTLTMDVEIITEDFTVEETIQVVLTQNL